MDFHSLVFLLVAIFIGVIIAIIAISRIEAKKRTQAMQAAAHEIGFDFRGDLWNRQPDAQRLGTALLALGTRRRFNNLMVGKTAGFGASLFDYSYTISAGEDSSTYTQTVAVFSQGLWLPNFELRPEGLLDRIGDAFLHRDINFDSHPEFSKRFFLRGENPEGIRKLFGPSLLCFLEQLPANERWHIEGNLTTLLLYQSNVQVPPEELRTFLDRTSSIAATFFSSPERLSTPVR